MFSYCWYGIQPEISELRNRPDGAGSDKLDPICEQPFVHLPSTSVAIDVRSIHCVPSKANQEVILNEGRFI